nr:hypothetical protein HK105_006666 [Polyrhizophydium stewartii]
MADKYIASCRPLLSDQAFEATKKTVEDFVSPQGLGPELQRRLVEYDEQQPNSWLEDIWLNKAYLEWREPSLINVNWWCAFKNHPQQDNTLMRKPPPKGVFSSFQVHRAAGIITNALNFKELLDRTVHFVTRTNLACSEQLPVEFAKDKPLCMNQYRNMFSTTRIPGSPADKIRTMHPAPAKHIIVLARDQIYKVDVLRDNGGRVPIKEIERQLFAATQDSFESNPQPAIGVLTAGHRNTWAAAYAKLLQLSDKNKSNFDIINNALFALCLDDFASFHNINASHRQIFHNYDAHNRWFDKALSFIVTSSGHAGLNGEPAVDPEGAVASPPLPVPTKLEWVVDSEVEQLISKAEATAKALIDDTESCLLQTKVYGSRYMKEVAKTSPDAYIQLALQLTYYRMHQRPTAVYETAATRAFKHGRTETVRSMSSESLEFIKSFDNDEILYDEKRALFAKAIAAQVSYMKDASQGKGIDRHMLGLRSMLRAEDKGKPHMFTDPAYAESMTFRLSTSNMSPGELFYGGFGPVVHDGYGINYAIAKDSLKFSISCKKSSSKTDAFKFRFHLERTLLDMLILFPRRTEVWGFGWEKRHNEERKHEHILQLMSKLSDAYLEKQSELAKRYMKFGDKDSSA